MLMAAELLSPGSAQVLIRHPLAPLVASLPHDPSELKLERVVPLEGAQFTRQVSQAFEV